MSKNSAPPLAARSTHQYGKTPPIVVCQPQAPHTDLSPKKAILFNQIGQRLSLPAIEPADDSEEQQAEDRKLDHERELIS